MTPLQEFDFMSKQIEMINELVKEDKIYLDYQEFKKLLNDKINSL